MRDLNVNYKTYITRKFEFKNREINFIGRSWFSLKQNAIPGVQAFAIAVQSQYLEV